MPILKTAKKKPLAEQISALVTGVEKRGGKEGQHTKEKRFQVYMTTQRQITSRLRTWIGGVKSMSVEEPTGLAQKKKRKGSWPSRRNTAASYELAQFILGSYTTCTVLYAQKLDTLDRGFVSQTIGKKTTFTNRQEIGPSAL